MRGSIDHSHIKAHHDPVKTGVLLRQRTNYIEVEQAGFLNISSIPSTKAGNLADIIIGTKEGSSNDDCPH